MQEQCKSDNLKVKLHYPVDSQHLLIPEMEEGF